MNKDEHDILKETIMDAVHSSHGALSKVFSDSNYEFKATLAVIMEKQDTTNEHLKNLNGKVATNADNIYDLQIAREGFLSSFKTAKWVVGGTTALIVILIGAITTLGVYAYNGDRTELKSQTEIVADKTESVADDLKAFQDGEKNWRAEMLKVLQTISKQK